MNVITAYLDTMFSPYPETPRLVEAKAELRGMMEDSYANLIAEGKSENEAVGQVIRDFGNLDELAPVLGISSDLGPASDATEASTATNTGPQGDTKRAYPPVTMEEATSYANAMERTRFRVSTAVALFVLAPASLIFGTTAASLGVLPISSGAATFIGLLTLLVFVTIGVLLMVSASRERNTSPNITEGRFTKNPAVSSWARSLAERHDRKRIRALQIAIALWIFSPVPLIAFSLLRNDSPSNDITSALGVVLVLVFVATGLGILLPQTWAQTVAETLDGTQVSETEKSASIVGVIAAFYWPLLVIIYLAWSFLGNAWGISWIIWPIGGVLFGAISAGTSAIENYRKARG